MAHMRGLCVHTPPPHMRKGSLRINVESGGKPCAEVPLPCAIKLVGAGLLAEPASGKGVTEREERRSSVSASASASWHTRQEPGPCHLRVQSCAESSGPTRWRSPLATRQQYLASCRPSFNNRTQGDWQGTSRDREGRLRASIDRQAGGETSAEEEEKEEEEEDDKEEAWERPRWEEEWAKGRPAGQDPGGDWTLREDEGLEEEARLVAERYNESVMEEIPGEEEEEQQQDGGAKKERSRGRRRSKLQFTSQVPDRLLPKIAIVGRPNVGKSALFNRIAGRDLAIVNDEPGVTRDRLYTRAYWASHEFLLADTGGVLTPPLSPEGPSDAVAITRPGGSQALSQAVREAAAAGLPAMIERHAAQAVEEAQAVILVVDGQAGMTAADEEIAAWLRRQHKPISLAVNKCESPTKGAMQASEFWALGFSPYAISAISGTGTGDLLDDVCSQLPPSKEEDEEEDGSRPVAIAIVGRPNVGKSSILNAMVGRERTIVSPISGTTRDAIDTDFQGPDGQEYRLIDTAGIRRRGAVAAANSRTEALSVNRAFRAIRRADVVALVIDAMQCVTEQDFRLGERIEKEGKACVIVVNKWDTVPSKDNDTVRNYEADVRERLRCLDWAPIVYTSAASGQRIPRILAEARRAAELRAQRLPTAVLNQVVLEAASFRPPPAGKAGKHGRIYYCTQAATRPPSFVFFVNDAKLFSELYRRFMEKQIRKNVGFPGTPIRLLWRSKKRKEREQQPQGKKTGVPARVLSGAGS